MELHAGTAVAAIAGGARIVRGDARQSLVHRDGRGRGVSGTGSGAGAAAVSNYASISAWEPVGISTYHSLQLNAEKRMSKGLSFTAGYTFSKSMDMGGGGNSASAESRNNIQNPRNVRSAYGLSDFNYAHRLTTSFIY